MQVALLIKTIKHMMFGHPQHTWVSHVVMTMCSMFQAVLVACASFLEVVDLIAWSSVVGTHELSEAVYCLSSIRDSLIQHVVGCMDILAYEMAN